MQYGTRSSKKSSRTKAIMIAKALLILALCLPLAAQAAPCPTGFAHCVVLTWSNPNTSPVVFHVYKSPGTCPAAGTSPSAALPPFAVEGNTIGSLSLTVTTYFDTSISPGPSCYYVTADTAGGQGGGLSGAESGPSNYAPAVVPTVWPLMLSVPSGLTATAQ